MDVELRWRQKLARIRANRRAYSCRACGCQYMATAVGMHWYCGDCSRAARTECIAARRWVARAIRAGVLMVAEQFRCVDCEQWAACWDHRDYSKPLDVEPVCKGCNVLRGPALLSEAVRR